MKHRQPSQDHGMHDSTWMFSKKVEMRFIIGALASFDFKTLFPLLLEFIWKKRVKKDIPIATTATPHPTPTPQCTCRGQEVLSSTLPHYPSMHCASAISLVHLIAEGNGGKRSKHCRSRRHVRSEEKKSLLFLDFSSHLTFLGASGDSRS